MIIQRATRVVHVPCTAGQDEDGGWCASVRLRRGADAAGDGPMREAATADPRQAVELLPEQADPPEELTLNPA